MAKNVIHRAYKYRMYPKDGQVVLLAKTFGCVRFIFNQMLTIQQGRYKNGEKFLSKTAANNYCNNHLKNEYPFLREVDKFAITNAIYHLNDAYERFFKKLGNFPKYKKKHKCRDSYTTNMTNNNIELLNGCIKLPKLGLVKAKIHRKPKSGGVLKSATVSMERDGTYYCSLLYEYPKEAVSYNVDESNAVGLDYKSDGLYKSSNGEECGSPKYYRKSQEKLAKLQRQLRHKQGNEKGSIKSKNYKKLQKKIAKLHRHIANQRKDFLHKQSTEIANQYDIVCVEDLDLRNMSNKGFGNGKATLDNGYGMFLVFLDYKLLDKGKVFIKMDKFYPSSQLCSCCGYKNPELKDLSIREWTCPVCGTVHDRDDNASKNIEKEGLRIYHAA